jgi:hypothetical protein
MIGKQIYTIRNKKSSFFIYIDDLPHFHVVLLSWFVSRSFGESWSFMVIWLRRHLLRVIRFAVIWLRRHW